MATGTVLDVTGSAAAASAAVIICSRFHDTARRSGATNEASSNEPNQEGC
jgi:hypothetical protein